MSIPNQKVAIVSGGSKGLGYNITKTLLSHGYKVATFSRSCTPELETLIHQNETSLFWGAVDISDTKAMSSFLREVKERFGRVGYLVNSAGLAHEGLVTLMDSSSINQMMRINVEGSIALTQMCVKQMMISGFGVIVNISSIVGIRGYRGVAAYSATKSALDGLTRSLSVELGSLGIRVNSVAPGFMETDMTTDLTEKQKTNIIRQTPLGRLGTVEDVSSVVSFLLSEDAKFITGQTLIVDGGLTV